MNPDGFPHLEMLLHKRNAFFVFEILGSFMIEVLLFAIFMPAGFSIGGALRFITNCCDLFFMIVALFCVKISFEEV